MARQKIAVLGGGAGALFAALAITEEADWSDRFEVTVYQIGWRLGGKGASSRNPDHNWRNEEHGLHVLGGFYHNSFRWLRSCYSEWQVVDPQRAIPFNNAFSPQTDFVIEERTTAGWRHVDIKFPPNDRQPGVNATDPTPMAFIRLIGDYVLAQLQSLLSDNALIGLPLDGFDLADLVERLNGALGNFQALAAAAQGMPFAPVIDPLANGLAAVLRVIRDACLRLEPQLQPEGRDPNPAMLMAIGSIIAIGLLNDRIYRLDYDIIENESLDDWGRRHGATDRVIDSPYSRAGYDYVFGYAGGVTRPPAYSLSAGVAMRWFSRMLLTAHGAPFWHMEGGMGEIVFVPLYQVLRSRGVKFEFFHRVRQLGLSANSRAVDRIELTVQAKPLAEQYDPLIDLPGHHRRVWPSRPRYGQLIDGDQLAEWQDDLEDYWTPTRNTESALTLGRGVDFDIVVLGISVGALPEICRELADRLPKWRRMLNAARTVPAAGVQIWSHASSSELGWVRPNPGIVTAFAQPFATWSDMSFLLRHELPAAAPARHLSYVCGPLVSTTPANDEPGSPFPQEQYVELLRQFNEWRDDNITAILPGASEANYGNDIMARANVSPSDHYVLSPPGNRLTRLHAGESGVENLFLAGDWTRNGLDAGAFEAAAMSGLQCAAAVTGREIEVHAGSDA